MSDQPVICVENLGKRYRISHQVERQKYIALRDVASERLKRLFQRRPKNLPTQSATEDFWALRNLSFQVKKGEVVGIIGRNGAGKSTLLKILSRITEPSEGIIRIKGRVASLLEVGTGFHPELTGRENILLNGAILGMSRAEIKNKFDEIVAFAEIEKFLDTPVKRYSSGMYVRLAFAVAAHLEPEILVVDEVLAVGDHQFQNRCLGKMREVSQGGRTVLFVSHNMSAIKTLTTRGIVLSHGGLVFNGSADASLNHYLRLSANPAEEKRPWGYGRHTTIRSVQLLDTNDEPISQYLPGQPFRVRVDFETDGTSGMSLEMFLADSSKARIGMASSYQFDGEMLPAKEGRYVCELQLQPLWLASGSYSLEVATSLINVNWDHRVESALEFDVPYSNLPGSKFDFKQSSAYGSLALPSVNKPRFEMFKSEQSTVDCY